MATEVRSEMVATVWKIPVEVGQQVDEDTTLVVLESMKMEIPILAGTSGVIASVDVAEGDSVDDGDLLATIANERAIT